MTLAQLKKTLNTGNYTPKTEEELLAQAQNRYAAEYGEKRLAAQQSYDQGTAALAEQEAVLAGEYQTQMADSMRNTQAQLSQADRDALSKGMQRSSYRAASMNNIRAAGEGSLNALRQGLLQTQERLTRERAQLATRLADTLAQYDISFEADVQAYLDTLRDQEYDREVAANQYADKIARALYEYELKAGKGGGSGSSGKKDSSGTKQEKAGDTEKTKNLSMLKSLLSGASSTISSTVGKLGAAVKK